MTIAVSDFTSTIDFYTSFCGFSVIRDRRKEGGGTVWLGPKPEEGELPLFLLVVSQGSVEFKLDHLGCQCDSREEVESIAKKADALGILVYPPTDSGGSVGYWTMIRDPDGHLVEFTFGQPIKGISSS